MLKKFFFLFIFFTALHGMQAQVLLTESFENPAFPPAGWSVVNNGTGNNWVHNTTNPAYVSQGVNSMVYYWVQTDPADTWAFAPALSLSNGDSLLVTFDYVVRSANYPESMKLTIGSGQNVAAQTTVLWNDSLLINETFQTATVGVRITANGSYNFAFNCYSEADEYDLAVDNIRIEKITPNDLKIHPYAGIVHGCNFGSGEELSIEVENTGASVQSNFPIAYKINNGPIISETFSGSLNPGAISYYTFNAGADFSVPGPYQLTFFTQLSTDSYRSNDTTSVEINSEVFGALQRTSIDTAFIPDNDDAGVLSGIPFCGLPSPLGSIIQIKRLTIEGIVHTYCDDLILRLISPNGDSLTLSMHNGGPYDNYPAVTFTDTALTNIIVLDANPIVSGYYHTQDSIGFVKFNGQDPNGMWKLRALDDAGADIGYVSAWTLEFATSVGITNNKMLNSGMLHVYPNPNNGIFTIESEISGPLSAEVYSINGQLLEHISLNGKTSSTVDLRGYAKGMYFIKAISARGMQTTKISVE